MNAEIENVRNARQTVRFMGMGFMPSEENGQKAKDALRDYIDSGDANFTPSIAFNVIDSISLGFLPSQEKCNVAGDELTQIIYDMRESENNSQNNSFRQRQ